jgi:hypothetical protein
MASRLRRVALACALLVIAYVFPLDARIVGLLALASLGVALGAVIG